MCTVNIKVDAANPPLAYERSEMMAVCDQRMDDIISGRSSTISNEEVFFWNNRKDPISLCDIL